MSKFNDKLNKFDEHNKLNDTSNKFERKRQLWLSSCSQESGTSADATYGRFAKNDLEKGEIIIFFGNLGGIH